MNTKDEILSFLNTHKQVFRNKYSVRKLALFGSYTKNNASEASDIDILIEVEDNVKNVFDLKYNLREYLKQSFHKEIDLCREKSLKEPFRNKILKEAIYVQL